ncbi:hypothetical protein ILYODFUR_015640 [Ilyodon furcidens]|uniref:Uncharacterized protein n=1 Tax=Ilyodon furcidens TaxID=33524 RepID=A0ABV0UIA0_9TELE
MLTKDMSSKMHTAESVVNHLFALHSYGTTKDHRKYMRHQVTLEAGKSMSLGFTLLAAEDAVTLLVVACKLFQELADVFEPEEAEANKQLMLKNMIGLMNDRTSVMKYFDQKFYKKRQEILNTD